MTSQELVVVNVARNGADVTGSDGRHSGTCYVSTPKVHEERVLQAGEELTALKSFRCLNSTADAARSGSSPTERVQTSTRSPAVLPQKAVSGRRDRPSRRCSTS